MDVQWIEILLFISILQSGLNRCDAQGSSLSFKRCGDDLKEFEDCQCGFLDNAHKRLDTLMCMDIDFPDASYIKKIPFDDMVDTLSNLTITGSNFPELPINLLGDCSHESGKTLQHSYLALDILDLSNNNINVIHGKTFHCMQNLRVMVLNDNNLDHPEYSPRMFSDLEGLEVLHLRNAFNFDRQGTADQTLLTLAQIFEGSEMESLRELHLEDNYIGSFDTNLFRRLPDLEKLYLSSNYLMDPVLSNSCYTKFNDGEMEIPCRLKEVYLNSNSITDLSQEFMDGIDGMHTDVMLDLSSNPFWCDCNFAKSHQWLKGRKDLLMNAHRTLCNGPGELFGKAVLSLNETDLQKCVAQSEGSKAGEIVLIIFCVAAVIVIIGLVLIRRELIKKKTQKLRETHMPRFFSKASGYNTVTNPASEV